MPPPSLLSVVVTTYNRSDALLAVLRALALQRDRGFEVIVADDGSSAEHVQRVHAGAAGLGLDLTHTWQADVGFTAAAARNMGVRQARGDYLVFLDGDCVPLPDFIASHRRLARPGCLVNGSRVLLGPALTERALRGEVDLPRASPAWWLGRRLAGECNKWAGLALRWPASLRRARAGFRWKGIRSCNLGVWRADCEAVDGFDEDFDGWGHEDADFVLRLHHHGCRRVDGFWATEVLHLWHREAARDQAQRNLDKVRQRLHDRIQRAAHGLRNPRLPALERRVLRLGPATAGAAPAAGTAAASRA